MITPIPNPNPLEIPATPARTLPHIWLYNIIAHVPSATSGMIRLETLPCDMDTGEIANGDHMVALQTDKLWEAVEQVPEVAAAMQAILAAVAPLYAWIEAQKELEQTPEPEPEPAAEEEEEPSED
jgi:hypothetical protein